MNSVVSPARTVASAPIAASDSHERRWRPLARSGSPSASPKQRLRSAVAVAVAGASLLAVAGTQAGGTHVAAATDTGFGPLFVGAEEYADLAPTKATDPSQINVAIGLERATEIAKAIGLDPDKVLTEEQYIEFTTGGGVPGSADPASAALADESVRIFTNTTARPPIESKVRGKETGSILASYGLFVTKDGWLESLANTDAPTRIANVLLEPGGYVDTWLPANGAQDALDQLKASAYSDELPFGIAAQQTSGPWQLVTNTKDGVKTTVGMSMVPALWITNFALLYTLNPKRAAEMPAYWAPIPENVVDAIYRNPKGRVKYNRFDSDFQ